MLLVESGKTEVKRRYRQTRRAESAADTRRRILDAARQCLTEGPLRNLNLDEVARRAGVSRSTVHLIYRSRSEFFVAMAKDVFERFGFIEVVRAFENADARVAFAESHQNLMRFYGADFAVHRAFHSLAALDPDVREALKDLKLLHREHCEYMAQRLREEGHLPETIGDQEAVDIIWMITSFETFSDLYSNRDLTADEVSQRLRTMAERSLGMEPAVRSA